MFGLFKSKKRLTDQMSVNIAIELGMMQSWTLQYRKCDLTPSELDMFIEGILLREGIQQEGDAVFAIRLMALANTDFDEMDALRKKLNFDQKVESFCRGIGVPAIYWTPKDLNTDDVKKPIRSATPFMDDVFKLEEEFDRLIAAGLTEAEIIKLWDERMKNTK